MTPRELLDWRVYAQLEGWESDKASFYSAAHLKALDEHGAEIIETIWALAHAFAGKRYQKKPRKTVKLQDYLVRVGDDLPPGPTRRQSWRDQKAMFKLLVQAMTDDKDPQKLSHLSKP